MAVVSQYHGAFVSRQRRPAKVSYPNTYATADEASKDPLKWRFNCAQRAHSNYLENLAVFLPTFLASSVLHPIAASVFGAIWLTGRIVYAHGYASSKHGSTSGRFKGFWYNIGQVGVILTAGWSAWEVYSAHKGI